MFYNFAKSYLSGPTAPENPWEFSRTAEWALSSPPPLENWDGRPSYASGHLEFLEEAHDGHAAATDGGHANEASDYVLGDKHPSHASIWPFSAGLSTLVFLLGLSGIAGALTIDPGSSIAGVGVGLAVPLLSCGALYPLFTVVGFVAFLYSAVKWRIEDF